MDCGLCFACCGRNIPCTIKEKANITKHLKENNIQLEQGKGEEYCKYLNKQGRCQIYNVRPLVCKKFGESSNQGMQCHNTKEVTYSIEFELRKKQRQREGSIYL